MASGRGWQGGWALGSADSWGYPTPLQHPPEDQKQAAICWENYLNSGGGIPPRVKIVNFAHKIILGSADTINIYINYVS